MAHSKAGIQLAVRYVAVFALVEIRQPVEGQALEMANEVGWHHGYEAALGHDASFNVVEFQTGVGTSHLT